MFPNFIVHYNRSEAFCSMSEVPQRNLQEVLSQLDESKVWGLNRFADAEYLPRRLAVEEKIRHEFIQKGGKPELSYPIYFFLGNNKRFEEHKRNIGYKIELKDVPEHAVSFTYGDSMFSMCENYRQKLGDQYQSRLCSQVYRLEELDSLFLELEKIPNRLHVECQLWIRPASHIVTRI